MRTLSFITPLLSAFTLSSSPYVMACDDFLKPESPANEAIIRAQEFQDRYSEPDKLDRFLVASRIKKNLDQLGVAYSEVNHKIIIKPIRKPGLNEFAFEMEKYRNIRVAFNMHTYSDRTMPLRDDYFQAYSDNSYTNLVLSEQFLKEVVLDSEWSVSEWLTNAKTYLFAFNQPNELLLSTKLYKSEQNSDMGMDEKIRRHLADMEALVYNLSHSNKNDISTFEEAQVEIAEFKNSIYEINDFLVPLIAELNIGSLFKKSPIAKYMDLNLISVGASEYKVLVSLNVNGSRISFYLKENIHDPYTKGWFGRKKLKSEVLDTIAGRSAHHLRSVYILIRGLNLLVKHTVPTDLMKILTYNQQLIHITSIDNKEFYY